MVFSKGRSAEKLSGTLKDALHSDPAEFQDLMGWKSVPYNEDITN